MPPKFSVHAQKGNVLFLILIAVALFAALSYAVTSSTRGGGSDVTKDKAEANAARLIQEAAYAKQAILRAKMTDGVQQVIADASAINNSGTCYAGSTATTPCKTVGLFHPSVGFKHAYPNKIYPPYNDYLETYVDLASARVQVNGVEVGTTAADTVFYVGGIDTETCNALNAKLNGTAGQYPYSGWANISTGPTIGYRDTWWDYVANVPDASTDTTLKGWNLTAAIGCYGDGTWGDFAYIIEEK